MEDNYVICTSNRHFPNTLVVGNKYHVEEAFRIKPEDEPEEDREAAIELASKEPNLYFYLQEFTTTCACCGRRIFFWAGDFKTQKQIEDANLEKVKEESGS